MKLSDDEVRLAIVTSKISCIKRDEDFFRELAKSNYVRLVWSASKAARAPFFQGDAASWEPNKLQLVYWLHLYDTIYESFDCPPQFIIDDNDAFDAWREKRHDKSEEDKKKEYYNMGDAKSALDHQYTLDFLDYED